MTAKKPCMYTHVKKKVWICWVFALLIQGKCWVISVFCFQQLASMLRLSHTKIWSFKCGILEDRQVLGMFWNFFMIHVTYIHGRFVHYFWSWSIVIVFFFYFLFFVFWKLEGGRIDEIFLHVWLCFPTMEVVITCPLWDLINTTAAERSRPFISPNWRIEQVNGILKNC